MKGKHNLLLRCFFVGCLFFTCGLSAQSRLLMRMDDMGVSHSVNLACIAAYQQGIGTAVEVMVTGPWFEEAVQLLNENPDLDVGVHLVLSSEWNHYKWRPLTACPSLVDETGCFFPMIWPNPAYTAEEALTNHKWRLKEIEQELRAQIELALKRIPHISHLSQHMGCLSVHPDAQALYKQLAKDYGLKIAVPDANVKKVPKWNGSAYSAKEKEKRFLRMLDSLAQDTYMIIGHLMKNTPESQALALRGYDNAALDRSGELKVYQSKRVAKALKKHNIQLISYKDL
ncbi:MAG: ChbG/HpnK family deacetylase [Bacteroidota bacterium]